MIEPRMNVEIKVRCSEEDLASIRIAAEQTGFTRFHRLRQRDTYVASASGRLKLREIETESGERTAELIAYQRADEEGARWSRYHRIPIAPEEADNARQGLALKLGIRAVVSKRRDVGIREAMRLHLDLVEGLGAFVELERVTPPGEEEAAADEMAGTVRVLGLDRFPIIAGSYGDLEEIGV